MKKSIRILRKFFCAKYSDYNSFKFRITKYLETNLESLYLVDVGANRGGFYDELTSIFRKSQIHALLIEPIPSCIKELENKFSNNKLIKICNYAVSNVSGKEEFFIYQFDETSSLLKIRNDLKELENINTHLKQKRVVTTAKLDDILAKNHFIKNHIDILKIDVQGYEDRVLLGATETLKQTKYIWIEVSFKALYEDSCLFTDIHSILTESGFILIEISDGHRTSEKELLQANCLYKNGKNN